MLVSHFGNFIHSQRLIVRSCIYIRVPVRRPAYELSRDAFFALLEKNSVIRLVSRIYFDMINLETEKNSFSGVTIWKLV